MKYKTVAFEPYLTVFSGYNALRIRKAPVEVFMPANVEAPVRTGVRNLSAGLQPVKVLDLERNLHQRLPSPIHGAKHLGS